MGRPARKPWRKDMMTTIMMARMMTQMMMVVMTRSLIRTWKYKTTLKMKTVAQMFVRLGMFWWQKASRRTFTWWENRCNDGTRLL